MSDPLPAPVFNLTCDVKPTDIGSGYASGIEQAKGYGEVSLARPFPPLPRVPSLEP
jgi:hypothetical protein